MDFVGESVNDVIIEVGPGRGVLTELFLQKGLKIICVERDILLEEHLSRLKRIYPHMEIIFEDIRKVSLEEIFKRLGRKPLIFSNLPFSITKDFFHYLVKFRFYFREAIVVFQREFVQNLLSLPGERKYSLYSVAGKTFFTIEPGFIIPPDVFNPRPKVFSQIIRMIPKKDLNIPAEEFILFLRKVFSGNRKKKLKNALEHTGKGDASLLKDLKVNPDERVYKISPENYVEIFKKISNLK